MVSYNTTWRRNRGDLDLKYLFIYLFIYLFFMHFCELLRFIQLNNKTRLILIGYNIVLWNPLTSSSTSCCACLAYS